MRTRLSEIYRYWLLLFIGGTLVLSAQTWQLAPSPTHQNLARLDMFSPGAGQAISYDGLILSCDGSRWTIADSLHSIAARQSLPEDTLGGETDTWGDFYTISMPAADYGLIAVNDPDNLSFRLLEFTGSLWHPVRPGLPLKIRAIHSASADFTLAAGDGGAFLRRNNSWQMLPLPVSLDFRAVQIVSPDRWIIAGEKGTVLEWWQSEWRVHNSGTDKLLRDVDFISETEGWLVGNDGIILHYRDGEIQPCPSPTTRNVWAIDMLSAAYGFAVGEGGDILCYKDGTWELLPSVTDADLHDIEMTGEDSGWIIGGRGVILEFLGKSRPQSAVKPPEFLFRDQVYLGTRHLMDLIDDVQGITAAHFNNDGYIDLYLTCQNSLNHLLLNDGNGYFTDFTIESGTGGDIESRKGKQKHETGSIAADFDRDGDTDLLICGKQATTSLFANDGKAIFHNVTESANLPADLNINTGLCTDFNLDGYPDLALVDEFNGLLLLQNEKNLHFTLTASPLPDLPRTGIRAIAAADFSNDFAPDLLLFYQQREPLFLQNSTAFSWQTSDSLFRGAEVSRLVNSVCIADFNNDGLNDLFIATENGKDQLLLMDGDNNCFTDQTTHWGILQEGRSYSAVAADFNLDGYTDLFVTRAGPDFYYTGADSGGFQEAAGKLIYSKAGYLSGFNTGAVAADIDGDHDADLVVGNRDFWSSLLENCITSRPHVSIQPEGVQDTREALGTKISIWPAGSARIPANLLAFREIAVSTGFFSQEQGAFTIGIAGHPAVDVQARFPNGITRFYPGVKANSRLQVFQDNLLTRKAYATGRAVSQFLHKPDLLFEVAKLLLFLAVIFLSVRLIEARYKWRPTHTLIYAFCLLALYGVLTIAFPGRGGYIYHLLPFGMIFFALLVLFTVNEPIRNDNERRTQRQSVLQRAGSRLSVASIGESAITVAGDAMLAIHPLPFLAIYLYQDDGNVFVRKYVVDTLDLDGTERFYPDRRQMRGLAEAGNYFQPLPPALHEQVFGKPFDRTTTGKALHFGCCAVTKEQYVQACIIALPQRQDAENKFSALSDEEETNDLFRFLALQLANTLHSISISREANEKEKLAAIGSFSSGVLHNLKNPVDGLRMMIEALFHDSSVGDRHYDYLRELHLGVLHLKNTLLNSFEIVNQSQSDASDVGIHIIIEEIVRPYQSTDYPAIELRFSRERIIIPGSPQRIKVALENIISNALEASASGDTVNITTSYNPAEEIARIEVSDDGCGIPVEQIDKIFDIFFSTRGTNRGLGLTLTREIIKRHGGHIDVYSATGKGTRMSVVLPARLADKGEIV